MISARRIFCLLYLLLLWHLLPAQQSNLPPVYNIVSDTALDQQLSTSNYQVLEDITGGWRIDDVRKPPLSYQFHIGDAKQETNNIRGIYWIRYRLKNTMNHPAAIVLQTVSNYNDFYLFRNNSKPIHLVAGFTVAWKKRDGLKANGSIPVNLQPGEELMIYQRSNQTFFPFPLGVNIGNPEKVIKRDYIDYVDSKTNYFGSINLQEMFLDGILFLVIFYNLAFFRLTKEREYLYFSLYMLFLAIARLLNTVNMYLYWNHPTLFPYFGYINLAFAPFFIFQSLFIRTHFKTFVYYKRWDTFLTVISITTAAANIVCIFIDPYAFVDDSTTPILNLVFTLLTSLTSFAVLITFILFLRKKNLDARLVIIGGSPLMLFWGVMFFFSNKAYGLFINLGGWFRIIEVSCLIWFVLIFSLILFRRFNYLQKENAQRALENERLVREKEMERSQLIEQQKTDLEKTVEERTAELKQSLQELKATQAQLIQSEKMASLGELTAGIAHEIQNPLNFVNNFSEVSNELIDEMNEELDRPDIDEAKTIAADIKQNLVKINHHGKRADAIVKGMLEHSRTSKGEKQPTNINALADEYLRLAYHGLRAKDKSFNVDFQTHFDEIIGKINIVPQDIGRVLLNLYNNAFYAVNEKNKLLNGTFEPFVSVCTKKLNGKVEIQVKDNGNGIPQNVINKVFQPFFTTKPAGQGTGLGLSLSYDIIKAHGGEIKVESKEGEGSEFMITLPI